MLHGEHQGPRVDWASPLPREAAHKPEHVGDGVSLASLREDSSSLFRVSLTDRLRQNMSEFLAIKISKRVEGSYKRILQHPGFSTVRKASKLAPLVRREF